eukprot:UN32126
MDVVTLKNPTVVGAGTNQVPFFNPTKSRGGHSVTRGENGKLYIHGGYDRRSFYGDLWCYDCNAHTMTFLCSKLHTSQHGCIYHKGELVVVGGVGNNVQHGNVFGYRFYRQIKGYNIEENEWENIGYLNYGRAQHAVAWYKTGLLIYGGMSDEDKVPECVFFCFRLKKCFTIDLRTNPEEKPKYLPKYTLGRYKMKDVKPTLNICDGCIIVTNYGGMD